jgi:hypothetical protein
MDEPVLKLAMSLHTNPGVYALLLGSGISRAAGIPTGWEIVLDLVRKVAAIEGEEPQPNLETWYHQRFGEPPDYSRLLDRLTATPAERMALLRSYFEPTEEEREQGLKTPTPAHQAIATLIKLGYVRMILTTNFDRLIEQALGEAGVVPDVISSDDDLQGAMPYVHSRCVVVKLNGDYRDTRIKNTPEELANYSQVFNEFLDRVCDEFSLLTCGWSGAWDTALRSAILRSPNRRFATYWLAKGEVTIEAQHIIQHRRAEIIHIESANRFFTELVEKLESLRELERPYPLSTAIAVATVKRYLVEPRHRIRLRDLIHEETERVYEELASERFSTGAGPLTEESFQQRMHEYEAVVECLMAVLAALSYHGTEEHSSSLTNCVERLARPLSQSGSVALINLQMYPALLIAYSAGISAIAGKRLPNLAAVLREPVYRDQLRKEKKPVISELHVRSVFERTDKWIPRPNAKREYTPVSNYLLDLIRPFIHDYLPDETKYEETFDIFEYLLSLAYIDLVRDSWAPIGAFGWRYRNRQRDGLSSPLDEFVRAELAKGEDSELLKAGFFEGATDRFEEIVKTHQNFLQNAIQQGMW